jgi:hypothetical protein
MKQCVEEFIVNYQDRDYEARYYSGNNPLVEVMDEIDNVVSTVRKMTLAANALSAFSKYTRHGDLGGKMPLRKKSFPG